MSRGRVEGQDRESYSDEQDRESYTVEPRVKPAAQHTVFVVVESSDEWDRVYWTVLHADTRAQAIAEAEEIGVTLTKMGMGFDRLED